MTYKANVGLNYPGSGGKPKRVEAGDTVSDLPSESIPWLLDQKLIEPVAPTKTAKVAVDKEPS